LTSDAAQRARLTTQGAINTSHLGGCLLRVRGDGDAEAEGFELADVVADLLTKEIP
jgi:hypothetical protein